MGMFYEFFPDNVALIGVEAGGRGIETGKHAASIGEEEGNSSWKLELCITG